jgi:hypothetical protein
MLRPALLALAGLALPAQAPAARAWTDKTTLSFVSTRGNAVSDTFGFTNAFTWAKGLDGFAANLGAIRATSEAIARRAVGPSPADFGLEETRSRTTTAEQYFANLRFDRKFKDVWYWYGGAGWERNRPAGLDGRSSATAGLGRTWIQDGRTTLKTDLGLGHTWESPVVAAAGARTRYGTGVLTAKLLRKVGDGAEYAADLGFTENLADTADWQGVLRQGLGVSLNKRLALKVGYDLVTRSRPKLVAVDLYPSPVAPAPIGKVNIAARKTDTLFTTSLVITF